MKNTVSYMIKNRSGWLWVLVFLSGCCSVLPGQSSVSHLEEEFRQADFTMKTQTGSLNPRARSLLVSMADPGQAYNRTDALDLKLPMTELIFAGEAPHMTFVFYNQGGIALRKLLFLAELNDYGDVTHACTWRLEGLGTYRNAAELKKDFPDGFRKEGCLK